MWKGKFDGARGFKTYNFKSSNRISGTTPAARMTKDGVFYLSYRRNCVDPDKKYLAEQIRTILNNWGKYLLVTDYKNETTTIEFYCKMEVLPDENTMKKLEKFLKTADY